MTEKTLKTRISHKIDIEENWNKATNFIPLKGEIIIYDIDTNNTTRRIKIGDGVKNVIDLEFLALPSTGEVIAPGGDVKPQIQVDWQQNVSSEVDYIKNRPFYENIDSFNTEFNSLISYDPIFSYLDEIHFSNLYMDFYNVPELEEMQFHKVSDKTFTIEELLLSTFIYSPPELDRMELKAMGMRTEISADITQELIDELLVFTDENNECIVLGPLAISTVGDKQYNTPDGGYIYFPEAGTYFGTHSEEGGLVGLKPKQTLKIDSDSIILPIDDNTNMIGKMISPSYISENDFLSMLQSIAFQDETVYTHVNLKDSFKSFLANSMIQETPFGWIIGENSNNPVLACVSTPFEFAPGVTIPEGLWTVYYSDINNNLLGGIISFELRKEHKYIENKFIKQKDSISNLCISAYTSLGDGTMVAISPHILTHELELSLLYGADLSEMGIDNYLFSGLDLKDMVIVDYYPLETNITIDPSFSYNFILPTSIDSTSGEFYYDYVFSLMDLEKKGFDPSKAYTLYMARSLTNKYLYYGTFVEKGGAASADQASNADTVDNLHFRISHEPPIEGEVDENTITFVV